MEVTSVNKLLEHWKKQKIASSNISTRDKIDSLMEKDIYLPDDFTSFYLQVNGMEDDDTEGFYFYKIDEILTMKENFSLDVCDPLSKIVIFGDYLHSSWYYGFRALSTDLYEVGIIPTQKKFKAISSSLSEFFDLYLKDSPLLYEHE